MKETTLNLYALDYRDMRTYMVAMLFILGNMVLPQLCHLIPQGRYYLVADLLFYSYRSI